MLTLQRGPVSRRSDWNDTFEVFSADGVTDPSAAVYTFTVWAMNGAGWVRDYGRILGRNCRAVISTNSMDGTGRLAPVTTDKSLVLAWRIPRAEMLQLRPGAYFASLGALIGDDTGEIGSFEFVIDSSPAGGEGYVGNVAPPTSPQTIVVEEF
ncbi:hypothetical protein J2X36_002153 [Methylobacterium sp. BE186]|uniref:hypothetical protein n=1 Tax=Methylobacterium sp. BE186 TaxID=2817715 RepID=UPI00285EF5D5|nr:hypothetical protein [Methylobacterium sp. BE186]MDR7037406.1 hypothetical protein [Methylobacterium sp. BE186]